MSTARRGLAAAVPLLALVACAREGRPPGPPPPAAEAPLACDTTTTPPPDSNFPAGFDYPQQTQAWVADRQGHRIRAHGWCLLAGLNQSVAPAASGSALLWQTWQTSTQAFPFQYDPWVNQDGTLTRRPGPLNAKNLANARVGGGGNAINFTPPTYPVNQAIVENPDYQACLQQIPGTDPPLYQLLDGEHFQSNGDIMVAGVVYNDAAIGWIQGAALFDAAALNTQLPAAPGSPSTAVAPLPSAAIVLKPMMWPVAQGSFTALPIWDWEAHPPGSAADGRYAGYEMRQFWTRAVAITDQPGLPAPEAIEFLYGVLGSDGKPLGPNTYVAGQFQVASVADFYHRQYQKEDLAALSACDRALLDASAWWAYDRAFRPGDYMVLTAMHVMTKEQPDWTFQSAWWHPDAKACSSSRFCEERPTNLADTTFQNYMLTTTYGQAQDQGNDNYYAPPGTVGPVWPVAYNPYIELAAAHPITTNCMNCHHRAAWPPRAELDKPDEGRASSYLQASPANPNALELFAGSDPVFNGLLTLDSMWAVSDRAGYAPGPNGAPGGAARREP
jgi:hypothetical protein